MTAEQQAPAPGPLVCYGQSIIDRITDFNDPHQEWRRLVSELLGTFFLVLAAAGGGMMGHAFLGVISHTAAVTAPALTVMAIILFMGKISGAHLNPAVGIAFVLRGRGAISPPRERPKVSCSPRPTSPASPEDLDMLSTSAEREPKPAGHAGPEAGKSAACSPFRQLSPAAPRGSGDPSPGGPDHPPGLRHPPGAGTTVEEFPAAVLARAARLLAGAQIVRLIRAFPATPSPGPAIGPARHPAGLAGLRMRRQCPELAAGRCQEHVTMTAEPPQSPAIEAVRSLEVRWIFPGQLETAVARWFARFPARTETREDTYLLDPQLRGLSVKVRGGGALEVKVYRGSPGILEVAGRARGRLQAWQKWSFPFSPPSGDSGDPPGWRPVRKRRRISRFSPASQPVVAPAAGLGQEPRCEVELTEVHMGGQYWWTLGFEATGPASLLRSELQATAALVFAQALPSGVEPGPEESRSYAEWLGQRPGAGRYAGA
jgi:hypothetical protein